MNANAKPRDFSSFPRNTREQHRKDRLAAERQARIEAELDERRRLEEDEAYRQYTPKQLRFVDELTEADCNSLYEKALHRAARELGVDLGA